MIIMCMIDIYYVCDYYNVNDHNDDYVDDDDEYNNYDKMIL